MKKKKKLILTLLSLSLLNAKYLFVIIYYTVYHDRDTELLLAIEHCK